MDGSRNSLYHIQYRAFKVFNKETKQNRHSSKQLLDKAFPAVPYSENKHINVKGEKSPYDGDLSYWSERNSKLYNNDTSKALKRQSHKCGHCGLKMLSDEKVHLHLRVVFGTSVKKLFLAVTQPLAVGIRYGLAVWWIAKEHTPWGWLGLGVEISLAALIYLVIAWLLVLNESERKQWSDRLNQMFSMLKQQAR
jgi:5-methylcytosine-specific restriction endonuclease McrA